MVCVDRSNDPERVAERYVAELGLKGVRVAFANVPDDLPRFPAQLGCQGFVVLDADLRFCTTRTEPALLDAPEAALAAAERAVLQALPPAVAAKLPPLPSWSLVAPEAEEPAAAPSCCGAACLQPLTVGGRLPSVGHAGMDAEHEALEAALRGAGASAEALAAAAGLLEEHFRHEEALLREVGFGGGGGELSPLAGHERDHARILALARAAAARALADGAPAPGDAEALLAAVEEHTAAFDTLYESAVAAA
mmetsp:Transcript_35076/g.98907  ORF Transcript_35076/g.98907 Transcript_35076/m.98907 type:complete len:251 (+) Transcript_35076:267-1019(+)